EPTDPLHRSPRHAGIVERAVLRPDLHGRFLRPDGVVRGGIDSPAMHDRVRRWGWHRRPAGERSLAVPEPRDGEGQHERWPRGGARDGTAASAASDRVVPVRRQYEERTG